LAAAAAVLAGVIAFDVFKADKQWAQPAFWLAPAAAVWPSVALIIASLPAAAHLLDTDDALFALQYAPLMGVSVFLIGRTVIQRRHLPGAATAIITIVAICVAVASAVSGQSGAHGLIAGVVLAGCAVIAGPGRPLLADRVVLSVASLCVLLAVYAAAFPFAAIRTDCQQNAAKCDLLGGFISIGQMSGSNAFGITLAMLAAFAVHRVRWSRAIMLSIAVCGSTLASGARLATACAVVCCLVGLLAKVRWGRVWTVCMLVVAGLSSLTFALVPFPPHSFTDRAVIWGRAREMIADAPWFGHGLSFWVRDAVTQTSPPRTYSPHNMWLDLGVAAGLVGTVLIAAAAALGILLSRTQDRIPLMLLVIGILVAGCWEGTFMPFRINPIPAGMVILLAHLSVSQSPQRLRHFFSPREPAPSA